MLPSNFLAGEKSSVQIKWGKRVITAAGVFGRRVTDTCLFALLLWPLDSSQPEKICYTKPLHLTFLHFAFEELPFVFTDRYKR